MLQSQFFDTLFASQFTDFLFEVVQIYIKINVLGEHLIQELGNVGWVVGGGGGGF